MKKTYLIIFFFICYCATVCAQMATDKDGNKLYGNNSIAIFTRITKYTVLGNADMTKAVPNEMEESLRIGMNVMASSAAQSQGLIVVNRDNETYKATQAWIEETKGEEYLEGIAAKAKNIGATHILIQDITLYTYGNLYFVMEIMYNTLSVQTNISSRCVKKYKVNFNATNNEISNIIKQEKNSLRKYLMDAFPVFFVLKSVNGSYALISPISAFGVDVSDLVFFYAYDNIRKYVHGQLYDFSKMELKSKGSLPKVNNGYLQVKLDGKINSTDNLVIKLGDCLHSEMRTYQHVPVAFVKFKNSGASLDDYCKKQINNAVYNAIYENGFMNLIESDELNWIKAERELQMSEEFIDGSVIEQFKASGAHYVLVVSDFSQEDRIVNFRMSLLNVATTAKEKDFLIKCHVSNVDKEVEYYINQIFVTPIAIGDVSKKQVVVYPVMPVASKINERFNLLYNKPIKNPIDGTIIYNRVVIAECTLSTWNIQEYILSIDKIVDKDDFEDLAKIKDTELFYIQKQVVPPSNAMMEDVDN